MNEHAELAPKVAQRISPEQSAVEPAAEPAVIGDGEAGRAAYEYAQNRFELLSFGAGIPCDYDLIMDVAQWECIREVLQRLLTMQDLEAAVRTSAHRCMQQLADSCGEDSAVDDVGDPSLPHGWLTILEAAYERLGDKAGLCRVYAYYIITGDGMDHSMTLQGSTHEAAQERDSWETEPMTADKECVARASHYVNKLRALAADQWPESVTRIESLYDRYYSDPMFHSRNYRYEALLRQERQGGEALRYCQRRCRTWYDHKLVSDMFDVMVQSDLEAACELLLRPLHNADSNLMRNNTPRNVSRIMSLLRRLGSVAGTERVKTEAERLSDRYRGRTQLRKELQSLIEA